MSSPVHPITYEECAAIIGTLPNMGPEPTFEKRRKTHRILCQRLATIPCVQSATQGHRAMVEYPHVLQQLGENAFVYITDPGSKPQIPRHQRINAQERETIKED